MNDFFKCFLRCIISSVFPQYDKVITISESDMRYHVKFKSPGAEGLPF